MQHHTVRLYATSRVSVVGPATWELAKEMVVCLETNHELPRYHAHSTSTGKYQQLLLSMPEAKDAVLVREIGIYDTCWWYSLCNFQYRQHYENTCWYNFEC